MDGSGRARSSAVIGAKARSDSASSAATFARFAPEVEVAYLKDVVDAAGKQAYIAKARRIGAGAVSVHWRAVDADFVAAAHALGLRVYSWHRGFELTPAKLAAGLDGLITDHPRAAREAIDLLTG